MPIQWTLRAIAFAAVFLLGISAYVHAAHAQKTKRPILTFAVMSDLHIHKHNYDVHKRLLRALDDYGRFDPQMDLMVMNGDLTNGFPSQYEVLRQLLKAAAPPPLHFTPGNHEFNKMLYNSAGEKDEAHIPNSWSSQKAVQLFKQFTGYDRPYHDVWVKGHHFIFLANEKSRDVDRAIGKHGWLSGRQLAWLEKKLKESRGTAGKPTFVFCHHPLPNTLPGTEHDVNIIQHQALERILSRHPEIIFFSGHTHYSLRKTVQRHVGSFLMLGSSSIQRHGESLYVEVYDGHVVIRSRDHERGEWIPDRTYRYPEK